MHIVVAALLTFWWVQAADIAQQPPKDFAIEMSFGCPGHWIDSRAGTFVRQIDNTEMATARVRLTGNEQRRLAAAFTREGFFDLPTSVTAHQWHIPGDGTLPTTIVMSSPRLEATLTVTMGGRRHSVTLHDAGAQASADSDAGRLQRLQREIIAIYRERPEVQRLPEPKFACL